MPPKRTTTLTKAKTTRGAKATQPAAPNPDGTPDPDGDPQEGTPDHPDHPDDITLPPPFPALDGDPGDNPPDDGDDPDDDDDPFAPDPEPGDNNHDLIRSALEALSKAVNSSEGKSSQSKVKPPDTFDGNNPKQLRIFLAQCSLNFWAKPSTYRLDESKIVFALSYLRGMALEFFEPHIGLPAEPSFLLNWDDFREVLETNFGPYDPEGEAEAELDALRMKDNQKINKYLVEFNRITARLQWGNAALRHAFYRGLPSRVKDEISRSGKSATLTGFRQQAATIDHRYWER